MVKTPGWLVVLIICVIPILLWSQNGPLIQRFSSPLVTLLSLGQIAALLGLSLFCLSIILSGRFKFFESLFGGMNRVYIAHHIIGGLAFISLLFHPALIISTYLFTSAKSALRLLLPSVSNWPLNFGLAAHFLLTSLLIITFYSRLPYHIWRLTHKFLGLTLFLASLHAFFIPSDISSFFPLRIYMLSLVTLSLSIHVYRTVLGRFLVRRTPYRVNSINPLAGGSVTQIVFTPVDKPIKFDPGQFIFINLKDNKLSETHPFSINSPPDSPNITIAAKAIGDYTRELPSLKPKTTALIEGPFGRFSYLYYPQKNHIWIAGGIGITPFMSMASSLPNRPDYQIDLYYSVKDKSEAVYLNELLGLAKSLPNLRLSPHFTSLSGRLDAQTILKSSSARISPAIFICGPPPMMENLRNQFHQLGIPHHKIHTEEFSLQ